MIQTPLMNIMVDAARKAGRNLVKDFNSLSRLTISRKGPADFVSEADKKAEEIIYKSLEKARPGYSYLMEEAGSFEGTDKSHRWIIDPLDGTTNFLHGIPQFAVSIALEREGQLVAGVIFNPITDEMFVAERGQGAYMNASRLRISQQREISEALVCFGTPNAGRGNLPQFLRDVAVVLPQVGAVRRLGAAALDLAFIAAGRLDVFWERSLSPWDMAAGIVIIREAGGFVTDIAGTPNMLESGNILAGNELMHGTLQRLLKTA